MSPKVSIVIPAHNEEKFLAATLERVCALDYPDFEVIVVDNASSDRTGEIAETFPVKLVREEEKGLLHARERGRVEATGEIIANVDADCLPEADWLKKGIRHFSDPKVIAVSGPYRYFDGSNFFRIASTLIQRHIYPLSSKIMQRNKGFGIIIGGNALIRAEALRKIGGYDTSIIFYGEDTDTARKVGRQGKMVFDPDFFMDTSARRFKDEGTLKIFALYLYNFFKTGLKKQA